MAVSQPEQEPLDPVDREDAAERTKDLEGMLRAGDLGVRDRGPRSRSQRLHESAGLRDRHERVAIAVADQHRRHPGRDVMQGREVAGGLPPAGQVDRFLVEGRKRLPVVLIDSYWRADGEPFCPAAEGLSHHINAAGFVEPCPVIQFSRDRVNGRDPAILYEKSEFLREFKTDILHKTKGCILMEDPAWLSAFAGKHGAVNTSNRPRMMEELVNAPPVASHGSCGNIPEKSLIYRLAKRTAFFGMGAYG